MVTTSLELSRKLKKAGFPQKVNEFYWAGKVYQEEPYTLLYLEEIKNIKDYEYIASPTADEILDLLPKNIGIYYLNTSKLDDSWHCTYDFVNTAKAKYERKHSEFSETLADAAALMWLFLKKENLI